jgi:hypothetical protein
MKTTGYLDNFFPVYASEDPKANALCCTDVEDTDDIMYLPRESFAVHLPDRDIVFHRHGKLHAGDFAQQNIVHVTRAYTKAEVE